MLYTETDTAAINIIRLMASDAITRSNSGHAGVPMGLAPVARILFTRIMNLNPKIRSGLTETASKHEDSVEAEPSAVRELDYQEGDEK
ncbi:hypothetical protein EG329_009584 [Mollisiaceae sp. DMI_Dod_QoI]|nr:hypothetical protein EG329_009584 [Helotiales sp. DMI_Dod_QoI]